jgi:hypothetical protein
MRLLALRVVLLAMAAGEALGGFTQVFRAQRMSRFTGRPYDPAYHGVVADFGLYNLAMALLLALAALDPVRDVFVLRVAIVLYAAHGGTHLLLWLGVYYGGETRIPTRPPRAELRDALPLLAALAAMLLLYPK